MASSIGVLLEVEAILDRVRRALGSPRANRRSMRRFGWGVSQPTMQKGLCFCFFLFFLLSFPAFFSLVYLETAGS
jgi:hypothetical protein